MKLYLDQTTPEADILQDFTDTQANTFPLNYLEFSIIHNQRHLN